MFHVGDIITGNKTNVYGITNGHAEMKVFRCTNREVWVRLLSTTDKHYERSVGRKFNKLQASMFRLVDENGVYTSTTYDLEEVLNEEDKEIIKKELNLITT